jgi:hypothetical protein
VLWHERLVAEPAVGHLAILLGNEVAWDRVFPIPSEAALRRDFRGDPSFAKAKRSSFTCTTTATTWALLTVEKIDER